MCLAIEDNMKISQPLKSGLPREGLTLRQAALIAGFAYLLSPVTTAEFSIMPKLVIPGNIEQTVENLSSGMTHGALHNGVRRNPT